MKTKKKLNKVTVAVLAILCFVVFSISAEAFDKTPKYTIGPNETRRIDRFVPAANKIYLNTRPGAGGDVTVTLSGAATGSHLFPTQVSVPDWEVNVSDPSAVLYIDGTAGGSGSSGTLHVWSDN